MSAVFYAEPKHRRRLSIAAGVALALGGAAFPLEWPPAIAGGLIGTAFGLWCAARKEDARGPVIELTPHALLYRGDIIARWHDVDHVDQALCNDRGMRGRSVLIVREFSRGDARPEVHRLDITEVVALQRDEILRLSRELAQRALTEGLVLKRHSPAGGAPRPLHLRGLTGRLRIVRRPVSSESTGSDNPARPPSESDVPRAELGHGALSEKVALK